MLKKVIFSTLALLLALGGSIFLLLKEKQAATLPLKKSQVILFYGDGCPHCAEVEAYLRQQHLLNTIEKKEIYHHPQNLRLLEKIAQKCHISQDNLGVPFLWTGKKCLMGDQEVLAYFKNKKEK